MGRTTPPRQSAQICTSDRVLRYTSAIFGVSRNDLTSPDRRRRIAWPRMAAMVALRKYCGVSTTVIGRILGGRDHTTIINAAHRVPTLHERYSAFAAATRILTAAMDGAHLIYISGPMTGRANGNRRVFEIAQRAIDAMPGVIAVNPHDIAGIAEWQSDFADLPKIVKYQHYMRLDLSVLNICSAVTMLPNWQNSPGAQTEIRAATAIGIPVFASVGDFLDAHPQGSEEVMIFISARCVVQEVRELSALLNFGSAQAMHTAWVPFSTMQPDDAKILRGAFGGERHTIRIEKWKADEIGLSPTHSAAAATTDLFTVNATSNA